MQKNNHVYKTEFNQKIVSGDGAGIVAIATYPNICVLRVDPNLPLRRIWCAPRLVSVDGEFSGLVVDLVGLSNGSEVYREKITNLTIDDSGNPGNNDFGFCCSEQIASTLVGSEFWSVCLNGVLGIAFTQAACFDRRISCDTMYFDVLKLYSPNNQEAFQFGLRVVSQSDN